MRPLIQSVLAISLLVSPQMASADPLESSAEPPAFSTGEDLAQCIANRGSGAVRTQELAITLTNASGQTREREAVSIRAEFEDYTASAIFFTEPRRIEGSAFLSFNGAALEDERRWLYLPATSRTRTIPTADRGDAFLGTDFSYDQIDSDLKFSLSEHIFTLQDQAVESGPVLVGSVTSADLARQFGYHHFEATIDPAHCAPLQIVYADENGQPLKTIDVLTSEVVDGIWTATTARACTEKTGHCTTFEMTNIRYLDRMDQDLLDPLTLEFGPPNV